MAKTPLSQQQAVNRYVAKSQRRFTLQCHREYDSDIIELLESKDSYNTYLKELLRNEARKEGIPEPEERPDLEK